MTVAECIHQEFSMVGTISDYGVRRFAREWGLDPNSLASSEHQQLLISKRISEFIDNLVMHPLAVSENGHSASWSESAMKQKARLALRQYGITPGEELASSMGLSQIEDASNLW
ncbi:DUF6706 family protein [Alistipes sp.]|uniref:DUF6706 family protein n=1 Tax=Alistipes sp. TaxID=1872444 RepID=UPI003AB349A7